MGAELFCLFFFLGYVHTSGHVFTRGVVIEMM